MEENEHNSWKTTIERMSTENQRKFIGVVLENEIPYTENKNGTFINISELNKTQLSKIKKFLEENDETEKRFNDYEKERKMLEKLICNTNQQEKKKNISNEDYSSLNSY